MAQCLTSTPNSTDHLTISSHLNRLVDLPPSMQEDPNFSPSSNLTRDIYPSRSTNMAASTPHDGSRLLYSQENMDTLELVPDLLPLPAHACSYCGVHLVESVVKCDHCDKWFCNGLYGGSGLHIVNHLVRLKHHMVLVHQELALEGLALECYNCGTKNVFVLGFVPSKQDSVVVILCRFPCAQQRDVNWDTLSWQALMEDRKFLSWVALEPTEEEMAMARPVSQQQIVRLETQWKLNRLDATMDSIGNDEIDEEEELLPVLMRYNDAFQYQRTFAPLVHADGQQDKLLKELQALEHIIVEWSMSEGAIERHLANFALLTLESAGLKVAVGDEIILRHTLSHELPWEGTGIIICLPGKFQESFTLELSPLKTPVPTHMNNGFTAEFVWKGSSYKRMQEALTKFAVNNKLCLAYLYHRLLGHEVEPVEFSVAIPEHLSPPRWAALNSLQEDAVRSVLLRPLLLIQGPPGTGKTVTSATIVYNWVRQYKNLTKNSNKNSKNNSKGKGVGGSNPEKDLKEKILVCAPLNIAVDHLVAKLHDLGLSVVRLTARAREDVDLSVLELSLHNMVLKRLSEKQRTKIKSGKYSAGEMSKLTRNAENAILLKADVICCTCVGAADKRLKGLKFRLVLIDESTQALEPELLIPLVCGAKQVVLVGDHQQLGPVILHRGAANAGLHQSLFERLILLGHVPIRLEVQYRMHPALLEFLLNVFYEGLLQNGVTAEDRKRPNVFPWPVKSSPMMFWCNYGREEILPSGSSYLNRVEAVNVERAITRLFKNGVSPDQIGVITPYEGQRAYILQYMLMNGTLAEFQEQYLEVEVTSVDAFQGREKDYIILLCVRASDLQGIGFLKDPRRMNVALTRAKYGLIVLGNPRALLKNPLWRQLLVHFRENGCLVEGTLDNLQFLLVQLHLLQEQTKARPFAAKTRSFDTQLMVSHVPEDNVNSLDAMWPGLGEAYSGQNKISANYALRLENLNATYEEQTMDQGILDITNAFNMLIEE